MSIKCYRNFFWFLPNKRIANFTRNSYRIFIHFLKDTLYEELLQAIKYDLQDLDPKLIQSGFRYGDNLTKYIKNKLLLCIVSCSLIKSHSKSSIGYLHQRVIQNRKKRFWKYAYVHCRLYYTSTFKCPISRAKIFRCKMIINSNLSPAGKETFVVNYKNMLT